MKSIFIRVCDWGVLRRSPYRSLGLLLLALGVSLFVVSCGSGGSANGADPSCDVSVDEGDCDNDGFVNRDDAFQRNACATTDSDGDHLPNTILTNDACDTAELDELIMLVSTEVPSCNSRETCEDPDDDNDMVNDVDMEGDPLDAFPLNACAADDKTGNNIPDAILTNDACDADELVALIAAVDDAAACNAQLGCADALDDDDDGVDDDDDEFPLDASKSCTIIIEDTEDAEANHESTDLDCDNDGVFNGPDNCPAVANDQTEDNEPDGVGDACDVDDDNDGLIELYDYAMLDNMRHNPDGSSYKTSAADSGLHTTAGMPATKPALCNAFDFDTNLCGYELGASFAFPGDWVPLPDRNPNPAIFLGSFGGIFEGNGYILSNLNYTDDTRLDTVGGLFDVIDKGNVIVRNLRLTGSIKTSMSTTGVGLGGIVGTVSGGNLIAVSSKVVLTSGGKRTVGGLVGGLTTKAPTLAIRNSFADGEVSGSGDLGGLVGLLLSLAAMIADSYAIGAVTGSAAEKENVGGLVGQAFFGPSVSVATSYARGPVDGNAGADKVGGLVGVQPSIGELFTNSYHSGNVADDPAATASDTIDTISMDGSQQTVPQLQGCGADGSTLPDAATGLVCTGLYTNWSTDNWDFGMATQFPALKYAELDDTMSADCSPLPDGMMLADLDLLRPNPIAQPYCGKLLPGQGR